MIRRFLGLALVLGLAACGKTPEEPLQPAPVAELQGPWLMVNRAVNCSRAFALFSPNGLFRVFEDKRPRKSYLEFTKFTLEPGRVTIGVAGVPGVEADVASLVFSLEPGKLRLIDMLGPKGASLKTPPANIEPSAQTYLQSAYRITEQHFAMDRCPGA